MSEVKALVLFSGGLDSVITVKLLQEQGISVVGLYVDNGFHRGAKSEYLHNLTNKLNIEFIYLLKPREFFHMWKNPTYGYGKEVNPCVNCHALMANIAESVRVEQGCDFIATGDVLEQRGNSQSSHQLKKVIKLIDNPGKILRPLSALKMKPTQMELDGIVDRTKLLGIMGKSRKIQYEFLSKYGLKPEDVESPAGGCILTEASTTKRVEGISWDGLTHEDFNLFMFGRQIKLSNQRVLILSRDKKEMDKMLMLSPKNFIRFWTNEKKSPIGYLQISEDEINYRNVSVHSKKLYETLIAETKEVMMKFTKFENESDKDNFQIIRA